MTRIYWKDEEREQVALAAAKILKVGEITNKLQALKNAQRVLPLARQRNIYSLTSETAWFPDALDRAYLELRRLEEVKESEIAAAALAAMHREKEEEEPVKPEPEPDPAPPDEPSFGDELRPVLVTWLAGIFKDALTQAVSEIAGIKPEPKFVMPPSKVTGLVNGVIKPGKKPSVLVAGLKGAQKQIIEHEFGHLVDLRFYESDKSKDQLRSMTEHADISIAFTDFLSHSHSDIMASRSKKYIPAGGGLTQLKDTIRSAILSLH